ncbi:MAG TPA: cadherin repeat domain-containing protein, partial [Pirellulaceae bacterium]|nr:cadherin repeat domain-containing protein [Pirellulaceae bacterium]
AEDAVVGTIVGILTTTDPDSADTHTYSLVDGDGDTDNESFNIVGNELHTAVAFDFETQTTYTIRVRSADQDGEFFEQLFTIFVSDVTE